MNLLIFTQKVDTNDTFLSFFHEWIVELAKHFNLVTVVCLYEGAHKLPQNVKLFSLGKERLSSSNRFWLSIKIGYVTRFFSYLWKFRNDYDLVFVHQNQEYVLLGGLIWRILSKKVFLWRNHYAGSCLTSLAVLLSHKIFCTSKYSYTAKFRKTVFMPVGVDTDFFTVDPNGIRRPSSILSLGRIAPSKRLEVLVEAFHCLKKENFVFSAAFCGDYSAKYKSYFEDLKNKVKQYGLDENVQFLPGVPNSQTPKIYSQFELFVNLSPDGMFDKTIFEAASCGCKVLATNRDLLEVFGSENVVEECTSEAISSMIRRLIVSAQKSNLREITIKKHSLKLLGIRLFEEMV